MKILKILIALCIIILVSVKGETKAETFKGSIPKDKQEKIEEMESGIQEEEEEIKDSLPGFNKAMFSFNDWVYWNLIKHICGGYKKVVPARARISIGRAYGNLQAPGSALNGLLQGKPKKARGILRFLINSTIGVGGFFDPAKSWFHIKEENEDFGQTLGVMGMGPGTYIVWPLLGPSNVRDIIGRMVDALLNPLNWFSVFFLTPTEIAGIGFGGGVNNTSLGKGENYERVVGGAIDPYTALRSAYMKNREKKVRE